MSRSNGATNETNAGGSCRTAFGSFPPEPEFQIEALAASRVARQIEPGSQEAIEGCLSADVAEPKRDAADNDFIARFLKYGSSRRFLPDHPSTRDAFASRLRMRVRFAPHLGSYRLRRKD
jgi:hypothetical protein